MKTSGVPVGKELEDFFPPTSVHYDLIKDGMLMIHTHGRAEYWVEAEQQKPTIGRPCRVPLSIHITLNPQLTLNHERKDTMGSILQHPCDGWGVWWCERKERGSGSDSCDSSHTYCVCAFM